MYFKPRRSIEELRNFILDNCDFSTGCWLWKLAKRHGYGRIRFKGVQSALHRVSYEIFEGKIPDGMLVCHKCDTPACCNPFHLYIGTANDNNQDRTQKGRTVSERSLSEKDILEINDLLTRFSAMKIAKWYGVSNLTIGKWCVVNVQAYYGNCRRCGRNPKYLKTAPKLGLCASCYGRLSKDRTKAREGKKTRKYTYKKKVNLRDLK